jgi:ATP-dependent RNA helicase HelY
VQSAFAIRYNTVLNLWDPPKGDRVRQMLQQSLAQYQASQRIRLIEHDILEVESDLHGVPSGCLIGYPDGDDLLDDYATRSRVMQSLQTQERRARRDLRDAERATETSSPWPRPTRQAIRRVFRTAQSGLVMHHQEHGWVVFLGRGHEIGVGIAMRMDDGSIVHLGEYREIDYLTDTHVEIPIELREPATAADATAAVRGIDLARLLAAFVNTGVPDLDQLATEHREAEWKRREAELSELAAAHRAADNELEAVRTAREAHPCHTCDVIKQHRRNQRARDTLERERAQLMEALERQSLAEELRIRNVIRGIRDVLHRFNYMRQGYPTPKADMLADIFDNDGLILCELIDRGLLDPLSPDELADFFSWFSFDREYRYPNHFTLPHRLVAAREKLEDLERDIIGEERDHRLFISEGHNPSFYGAALAWCRGATMAEIGESLELSEGDLVITFNKTIDLLRQVREMLMNIDSEHPLRPKLDEAIRRVRRGIVAQSLALGFTPIAEMEDEAEDDEELAESDDDLPGDEE